MQIVMKIVFAMKVCWEYNFKTSIDVKNYDIYNHKQRLQNV